MLNCRGGLNKQGAVGTPPVGNSWVKIKGYWSGLRIFPRKMKVFDTFGAKVIKWGCHCKVLGLKSRKNGK